MGTTLSDGLMVLSDIFLDQGGWGTVSLRWPTRERSFAAAKKGQRLLGPQNDRSRCSLAPLCVEEEADRRGQRPVRDGVVGQSSHSRLRGARLPPGAGPLGPALVSIPASWELGVPTAAATAAGPGQMALGPASRPPLPFLPQM